MEFIIAIAILLGIGALVTTFICFLESDAFTRWILEPVEEYSSRLAYKPVRTFSIQKISDFWNIDTKDWEFIETGDYFSLKIEQEKEEVIFLKDPHGFHSVKIIKHK